MAPSIISSATCDRYFEFPCLPLKRGRRAAVRQSDPVPDPIPTGQVRYDVNIKKEGLLTEAARKIRIYKIKEEREKNKSPKETRQQQGLAAGESQIFINHFPKFLC